MNIFAGILLYFVGMALLYFVFCSYEYYNGVMTSRRSGEPFDWINYKRGISSYDPMMLIVWPVFLLVCVGIFIFEVTVYFSKLAFKAMKIKNLCIHIKNLCIRITNFLTGRGFTE